MFRNVSFFILLLASFAASGCAFIKAVPPIRDAGTVAAYDTGSMKGAQALSGSGHLVRFSSTDTRIRIDSIFIYCCAYGHYGKRPKIFILDAHYRVVTRVEADPAMFPNQGKGLAFHDCYPDTLDWVKIPVGNVVVENDFYVLFYSYSDNADGVMIGYTGGGNDGRTAIANVNRPLAWTLPMRRDWTNWIIRASYASSSAPLTRPLEPADYRNTARALRTPEELSQWMVENLYYDSSYLKEKAPLRPEELFAQRSGNCGDFAAFAFDILQQHGFSPLIMAVQISLNDPNNHAVCVFGGNGKYYIINNSVLQGPFGTYEEIAAAHNKNWWRYLLFDNVQDVLRFQNPVSAVYR